MSGTALPTNGRFPVRRKRPNRPPVDNALRASWRPRYGDRFIAPTGNGLSNFDGGPKDQKSDQHRHPPKRHLVGTHTGGHFLIAQ